MSNFTLYGYGESVASNMARLALSEKKIKFNYNLVYLESKGDHLRDSYKKLNPKNRICKVKKRWDVASQKRRLINEIKSKVKNEKVILCERGVSVPHTHKSTSRFLLDLQVIPAAKEITHLPIVSDPSHATFWRPWVYSMSLASIAAGSDGIMLEVHPNPSKSAVDPLQPIDFSEFRHLMKKMNKVAKSSWGRRVIGK